MSAIQLTRLLIDSSRTAGKELAMYIVSKEKEVMVLAILYARIIAEDKILYVFIGSGIADSDSPYLYIANVHVMDDSFIYAESYASMKLEDFLAGFEGLVFSNDYISAWMEKADDRLCRITIINVSNVIEESETKPETREIKLPMNYFGICPF